MDLISLFHKTYDLLSSEQRKLYRELYRKHNLSLLSKNLIRFHENRIFNRLYPYYEDEITPDLELSYDFFRDTMVGFYYGKMEGLAKTLKQSILSAGIHNILVLMGQRMTAGSIDRFPPDPDILIAGTREIHAEGLSVAARAWSKHVGRSDDKYWGEIIGKTEDKNKYAEMLIDKLFRDMTWWNIFGHVRHEYIYEIRVASGHGARWTLEGKFIGFVEPFTSV